jgi:hypothetical protein
MNAASTPYERPVGGLGMGGYVAACEDAWRMVTATAGPLLAFPAPSGVLQLRLEPQPGAARIPGSGECRAERSWDLMRKLASGGLTPDLTGRGCTLTAPASGKRAAAARQMPGRWCRMRSGASRHRRSLPWCPLAPAVS